MVNFLNYSVSEEFEKKEVEELFFLLDKYPEFIKTLEKISPRYNKKTKQNKLKTAKFKFVIVFCKREIKKKLLGEKNVETNNNDKEKKDI